MTTTTARPRGRKGGPKVPVMEETLDEFGAQIDAHLGRAAGFAEAVRTWRAATDLVNALSNRAAHRAAIATKLDGFIAGGAVVDGKPLTTRAVGGGTRRVLRSAVVEAAHPTLWVAARVTRRVMSVKHPNSGAPELVVPPMRTAAEAWDALAVAKARARAARKDADEARSVVFGIIDATSRTWDGSPLLTADGWRVGVDYQTRFNEALCRELAAEQGIDLGVIEEDAASSVRVTYVLGGVDVADEFDGD